MAIATTKMIENVIAGTTLVKIAQKANQDGNGANIVETYAKQNGNYPNMTVGNSTNADNAAEALKATQDAAGNNIQNTYATKTELSDGLADKQPVGDYALQNGNYPEMSVGNATNAQNDGEGNNIADTYPVSLELSINSDTYVITAQLKNAAGQNIGTPQTIDLPLESVVVSGSYDDAKQAIVLTLENGSTIDVPVGDLVDGLASQTSVDNIINGTTTVGNANNLGGVAANEYARTTGTYSGMTVGNATNAQTAASANKVANALTIKQGTTTTTYNGSAPQTIDLGDGSIARTSVSIPTTAWANNSVTLSASAYPVLGSVTTTSDVLFIADNASAASVINNVVDLTGQAAGSITFSCATIPAASVSGRVIILN